MQVQFENWKEFEINLEKVIIADDPFVVDVYVGKREVNGFIQGAKNSDSTMQLEISPSLLFKVRKVSTDNPLLGLDWNEPDFQIPNYYKRTNRDSGDPKSVAKEFADALHIALDIQLSETKFQSN